jgi:PleD family two-component response regulator
VARYINKSISSDGKVMLRVNDFSPTLAFYLKNYRPESIMVLDDKPSRDERIRKAGYNVFIFERDENLQTVKDQIRSVEPDFVMIRTGFRSADGTDIAAALSELARPTRFDTVWVFDGGDLSRALGRSGTY